MRRTISITEEVWREIAKRGQFGETPNDVLKRVFRVTDRNAATVDHADAGFRTRRRRATQRMSAYVKGGILYVAFADGPKNKWLLGSKDDKKIIREVRREAVRWAEESGATNPGQTNAVKKALTDAGYYITK